MAEKNTSDDNQPEAEDELKAEDFNNTNFENETFSSLGQDNTEDKEQTGSDELSSEQEEATETESSFEKADLNSFEATEKSGEKNADGEDLNQENLSSASTEEESPSAENFSDERAQTLSSKEGKASAENSDLNLPELGEKNDEAETGQTNEQAMDLVSSDEAKGLVEDFDPYNPEYKPNLDTLLNIKFDFILEIGRAKMKISDILLLGQGSVIELNKLVGEDLNIMVNDKWIAKGEIVICRERFGTRILHILSQEERLKKLGASF